MDRLLEQYLVDNNVVSEQDPRFKIGNNEYFKLDRQQIINGLNYTINYICGIEINAYFKAFGIGIKNMELIKQSLPVFTVKDKTYVEADFDILNNIKEENFGSNEVFDNIKESLIFGLEVAEATANGSKVINWCDTNKETVKA